MYEHLLTFFAKVSLRFLIILFYFLFYCLVSVNEGSFLVPPAPTYSFKVFGSLPWFRTAVLLTLPWHFPREYDWECVSISVCLCILVVAPFLFSHVYFLGREIMSNDFFYVLVWICWLDLNSPEPRMLTQLPPKRLTINISLWPYVYMLLQFQYSFSCCWCQQNLGPKTVEADQHQHLDPRQFLDHSPEGLRMAL